MKNGKYVGVEEELDIYSDRRWLWIPGFNGYEISTDGYLRSMKHFRRYPFGMLIKPNKKDIFTISDNNNNQVRISREELYNLAINNKKQVTGYPRLTTATDVCSRNQRIFVNKKQTSNIDLKAPADFKFKIINEI